MKLLVRNTEILKLLKDISVRVVELFGSSEPRKAQNLIGTAKNTKDYDGMYVFLSIFLDPISGHHENLAENDQKIFMDVHKIIEDANILYRNIPPIDADDYTPEKISEYNTVLKKYGYVMHIDENLEKDYEIIKGMSKEEEKVIHFVHHCFLVKELEMKLTALHMFLVPSETTK